MKLEKGMIALIANFLCEIVDVEYEEVPEVEYKTNWIGWAKSVKTGRMTEQLSKVSVKIISTDQVITHSGMIVRFNNWCRCINDAESIINQVRIYENTKRDCNSSNTTTA